MRIVSALFWGGLAGVFAVAGAASASQLTYVPVNPTFGGNTLNGSYLLSTAQAQGKGKAGSSGSSSSPDLSGLNSALDSLGNSLSSGFNTNITTPVIVIPTPTTPTNP